MCPSPRTQGKRNRSAQLLTAAACRYPRGSMNARTCLTGLLMMTPFTTAAIAQDARFQALVPADARVERLATGMKFTEGPVWTDADGGYLVFSDIPSSELKKWVQTEGLTTYATDTHETNGNTRDREGRLISC